MRTAVVMLALALAGIGCGGDDGDGAEDLEVSAAASLKTAFEDYAGSFEAADVRFSFAGSDELAAQIRQGAKPDLYAAANTTLPQRLFEEGRLERPTVFAGNELVIAVPAGLNEVSSIDDLAGEGVRLVVGDEEVPVGSYTREVLDGLPPERRDAILDNVRSEEPDVLGIVSKLRQGAATAGFLYATDVRAADGELEAIRLPERLGPEVAYGIAVVRGSDAEREARLFVDGLLEGEGRKAMARAGFLAPP